MSKLEQRPKRLSFALCNAFRFVKQDTYKLNWNFTSYSLAFRAYTTSWEKAVFFTNTNTLLIGKFIMISNSCYDFYTFSIVAFASYLFSAIMLYTAIYWCRLFIIFPFICLLL